MRNIFAQTKDYVDPPKRNVFDLSHSNHSTFQFGYLYPVLCQPVIPGDSFDIDPTFALRFLPTAFPVQTKITANLHFFYVRNRNLWDKWTKFIGHTHDTEFPYLDGSQDCIKTGGLADYLGVPTTVVGDFSTSGLLRYPSLLHRTSSDSFLSFTTSDSTIVNRAEFGSDLKDVLVPNGTNVKTVGFISTISNSIGFDFLPSYFTVSYENSILSYISDNEFKILFSVRDNDESVLVAYVPVIGVASADGKNIIFNIPLDGWEFSDGSSTESFQSFQDLRQRFNTLLDGKEFDVTFESRISSNLYNTLLFRVSISPTGSYSGGFNTGNLLSVSYPSSLSQSVTDISDLPFGKNPFIGASPSIRLNALPFRAYESIYNAFYRNEQNDPLMINGEPEYDKYLPNDGSGADSFPYQLYKRNWELDFLSSAVQSPQQGIAPLVGVSSSGDFTFVHKDDNGNIGYFSAKAQISADGKSISGVQLSDSVELDGLPTTPIVADIPESVKRGSVYTLNQMALAGISINDFRNVNALQRWLETNIRRGFKYRDQIKSHFGIDVDFDVLDMPEFIGGISEPVYSSQVNQTSETADDPLGSYAGQLSLIASSKHSIRHYCHEHGYIIGIFSVVPVPNYSQLLPKDFIKSNYLDFYFPEFSHIGMQPIDYREVCPLQAYGVNPDNLLKTFGYQRPWYDYIANVDSVHGLFRTNLRNFVLNRQFDTFPMLNKDFLQVDPTQLNDIFTVDDVSDKILGQIQFNIIAKRPIPRFGIPRLE